MIVGPSFGVRESWRLRHDCEAFFRIMGIVTRGHHLKQWKGIGKEGRFWCQLSLEFIMIKALQPHFDIAGRSYLWFKSEGNFPALPIRQALSRGRLHDNWSSWGTAHVSKHSVLATLHHQETFQKNKADNTRRDRPTAVKTSVFWRELGSQTSRAHIHHVCPV